MFKIICLNLIFNEKDVVLDWKDIYVKFLMGEINFSKISLPKEVYDEFSSKVLHIPIFSFYCYSSLTKISQQLVHGLECCKRESVACPPHDKHVVDDTLCNLCFERLLFHENGFFVN